MRFQGQYNGSDSEADQRCLNTIDWWLGENSAQAVAPEIHSEGVCNCRPIPAELSQESVA